jgi:hypothetical protein
MLIFLSIGGIVFFSVEKSWKWIFLILLSKVLAGLFQAFYFFQVYGGGDTLEIFEMANQIAGEGLGIWLNKGQKIIFSFGVEPIYSIGFSNHRTAFLAWLLGPFIWFTSGSFWLINIYLSIAITFIYLGVFRLLRKELQVPFSAFLLSFYLPSVLFWSSGIQKETLTLAAFFLLLLSTIYLVKQGPGFFWIFLGILSFFIIYYLRPFQAVALVIAGFVGFAGYFLLTESKIKKKWKITVLLGFSSLIVGLLLYHPVYGYQNLFDYMVQAHQAVAAKSDLIFPVRINPSLTGLEGLIISLKASWIGIFGLWPVLAPGISYFVLSFEGILILFLLGRTAIYFRSGKAISVNRSFLFSLIFYSLILAWGIVMSTPNFGSILRYRLAFVPLLIPVLYLLPNRNRL